MKKKQAVFAWLNSVLDEIFPYILIIGLAVVVLYAVANPIQIIITCLGSC